MRFPAIGILPGEKYRIGDRREAFGLYFGASPV